MSTTPSKIYTAPGYVKVFSLAGVLCVILGIFAIGWAISEDTSVLGGVALLIAAFANFLYAEIADSIARTQWRVELMAHELQPMIDEGRAQLAEREERERAAQLARDEEIRRVVEARQASTN